MSESPDPQAAEPVAEVVEPAATEAAEAIEAAAPAEEGAEPAGEPAAEPEKPADKKSPVAQLQGRVGHLTKTLHEKDAELASERRQRETLEALLAAQGRGGGEAEPAAPVTTTQGPAPGSKEFEDLVDAAATQKAASARFTADCNAIFEAGEKTHGAEFKEGVASLNALGMMNEQVVQAAMASGAAADVINYLGADVDEAARITGLPPIQMAAELTKVAQRLSVTKTADISRTPAPITPLSSTATVEANIYDPKVSNDMAEYARLRQAQGAVYARPPSGRH